MNVTTYIGMQAYPKQFKHFDITDTQTHAFWGQFNFLLEAKVRKSNCATTMKKQMKNKQKINSTSWYLHWTSYATNLQDV